MAPLDTSAVVWLLTRELRRGLACLVELQVRDVLKVSEIAREQGQVMLKGSRCNKDIQIADLPTDGPGKRTPHDGKGI